MLGAVTSGSGLWFLLTGYLLVAAFIVIERTLRRGATAKTLRRGNYDRGSTLLIAAAFGAGLLLPILLDGLGVGVAFPLSLPRGLLALAVMGAGIGLRSWAASSLGSYYTRTLVTTSGQKVVSTGPYARVRHPGYLGDILLWSGFGVLSGNLVIAVLFPVMFAAIYIYRISVEEGMLVAALGDDYVEYQRRTYRLIPLVY
jgi:protein-S-isoprenylcysteine O-methyltransferase Ste14